MAEYKALFPYHKLEAHPERNTVMFRIDEETIYSVEEMVGMILQHVVELGSEYAGEHHGNYEGIREVDFVDMGWKIVAGISSKRLLIWAPTALSFLITCL